VETEWTSRTSPGTQSSRHAISEITVYRGVFTPLEKWLGIRVHVIYKELNDTEISRPHDTGPYRSLGSEHYRLRMKEVT